MKVIPFPGEEPLEDPDAIAGLESAMAGSATAEARAWRELSTDIRSLAPRIGGEFEASLHQRLSGHPDAPANDAAATPARPRRAWPSWRSRPLAPRLLSLGAAGGVTALLIAVLIIGPLKSSPSHPLGVTASPPSQNRASGTSGGKVTLEPAEATSAPANSAAPVAGPAAGSSSSAGSSSAAGSSSSAASSPGGSSSSAPR